MGTIFLHWQTLPREIPLWINRPWGIDQLAGKWEIFWIPTIILVIQFIGMVSVKLFRSDTFLSTLSLVTISISQVVCTLALIRIIALVS
jgi:hypothetical protein